MRLTPTLSLVGLLTSVAAQHDIVHFPFRYVPTELDSGYLDNQAGEARVVFSGRVQITGAVNLRLYFERTNLPEGTRLRLTSARDAAIELFDGVSLADYKNYSSWFNGDTVLVELVAAPRSVANRVRVIAADAGEGFVTGPQTICGPTDDRQPSTDARVARQYPTGCTTWLVDKHTVLTAGHCTASAAQEAHFNVPPSNGSTIVLPPPQHQYRYDSPTLRRLDAGVGQDWTVASTLRNATTGLYAGQAQGAAFTLAVAPAFAAGQQIRITGCGTSSVPNRTQTQQTHVGPRASTTNATAMAYQTDTTGGNSGSPVIFESSGAAVGIHTHGGCSSSGTGSNLGTSYVRPDLQAAVTAVKALKRPGCYELFGNGCGAGTRPSLANSGFPDIGRSMSVVVTNAPAGAPTAFVFGVREVTPIDLSFLQMPGCLLYTSVLAAPVVAADGTGRAALPFTLPNIAGLIGVKVANQGAVVNPAANAAGVALSNAGESTIGQ